MGARQKAKKEKKRRFSKGLVFERTKVVKKTSLEARETAEKILEEIRREELESTETLKRIERAKGKGKVAAEKAELEGYLNSGMPLLLVKLKENIVNETMKEEIRGPATERLKIISRRLKEAGFEEKLKEAEKKLGQLVAQGDSVTKSNALRAAGDLGLNKVVKMAAEDKRDHLLRKEAGIIAIRTGMKDIAKKMIEDVHEIKEIKEAIGREIDLMQGKYKKRKKITRKWVP